MDVASAECKYLIFIILALFSTMTTFILIYCPYFCASAYDLNAFQIMCGLISNSWFN